MIPIRTIPALAGLRPVGQVTASESERLALCPLRFVLDRDPALRGLQPFTAAAILGSAAHSSLASLIRAEAAGVLSGQEHSTRAIARTGFDESLSRECARRDRAIAERGPLPGDSTEEPASTPFYAMTRARFVRFASQRFGETWRWAQRAAAERAGGQGPRAELPVSHAIAAELRLASRDGLVVGIADSVDRRNGQVAIEEFKTGEATPDRLGSWKQQLLIYAHLYLEHYGTAPSQLRIYSLPSGPHEFTFDESEGRAAADAARAALQSLNQRLAAGAKAADLAQPAAAACTFCPHRPWCEPYWRAGMPGSNGADLEGTAAEVDGWAADMVLAGGSRARIDFKGVRVRPIAGARMRVCGTFRSADGSLRTGTATSVWRLPP